MRGRLGERPQIWPLVATPRISLGLLSVFQQENEREQEVRPRGQAHAALSRTGVSHGENQRRPCWAGKLRAHAGPFRFEPKEISGVLRIFGPGLGSWP